MYTPILALQAYREDILFALARAFAPDSLDQHFVCPAFHLCERTDRLYPYLVSLQLYTGFAFHYI